MTESLLALRHAPKGHYEIAGNFPVDDAIIHALPPGLKIVSADSYGSSAWSVTARINAVCPDGSPARFFLKCTTETSGKAQLAGEFAAMSELYKTIPSLVPRPLAHGQLHLESPPTYFFLCDFVNISDRLPDPVGLGVRLAELHRNSLSPTGKFGFYVPTYDGKLPQTTGWDSSWASFFGKLLLGILRLDVEVNGPWKELEDVAIRVVEEVIPRLLGVLESEGRSVKPCLIHGDLWEGNVGTDLETGNIYIFDACSYYAHNEMEIGMWRTEHHRMKAKAYKREYLRNMEPSEPIDEWDDRNRLYSDKTKLMYSAHVPGTQVRNQAFEDFNYLVEKYASKSSNAEELPRAACTSDS
ncbi:hypothetical protein MMC13_005927 [Lambiella insularis]|nr:hypothetical protein [Lambiella insularis]